MLPADMQPPAELITESSLWGGRPELVQAAGGNLSAKVGTRIWIKASGTRLADATNAPIYLPLDLAAVSSTVLETEDLSSSAVDIDGVRLRPSIETALHALLPHRYVTHLHATGVIARAVTAQAPGLTAALPIDADLRYVPYAKPGVALARALLEAVGADGLDAGRGLVAVLGNHGLLVADDDLQSLVGNVLAITGLWVCPPIVSTPVADLDWIRIAPAGWLDERQSSALLSGVLTPDEAVFLGPEPWGRWEDDSSMARARVAVDGSVWISAELGEDAAQIARSFAEIARALPADARVVPLADEQVAELLDWEAEKWRKAMER